MPDPAADAETTDRRFADAALRAGALTPAQLEQSERRRREAQSTLPLSFWLVRDGVLAPDRRDEIERSLFGATASATVVEPPHSPTRGDAAASAPAPAAPTAAPGGAGAGTVLSAAASAVPMAAVGRLGKYELLEEIGRGGMGVVYRALDTELRREVALKTLLLGDRSHPERVERLMREARTAAALEHPGIVPIHDIGVADGVPFFAMTFLRGRTFDRLLHSGALVELRDRVLVVLAVAEAVAYAHRHRVIHRDLKPANILVDDEGQPHVMDFGLAKRLDEGQRLTATGEMLGTPEYMPPEQINGDVAAIGPHTDVYALGAVLYEALTGRPPFEGANVTEVVGKALGRDPVSPRALERRVPADLETICLKALNKEPERRYPSAQELAADLERYWKGEAIQARPSWLAGRLLRRAVRHKAVVVPTALAVGAACGIAWFGLLAGHEGRSEAAAARETMRKAARAQDVLARWLALGDDIRALEASYYSPRSAEEKRRAGDLRWSPIEEFMSETPADPESQATMRALAGWTRRLAGYDEEGAAWMERAHAEAPELPFGALLDALVCFAQYLVGMPFPPLSTESSGLRFGAPPPEPVELTALRERLERRLAEAAGAAAWGGGSAQDLRAVVDAMGAFAAGRWEESERGLTAVLGTGLAQALRSDLRLARAHVRFRLRRFAEGLADVEAVVKTRPEDAPSICFRARLRAAIGAEQAARGEDPRPALDQAIADYDDGLRRDPRLTGAFEGRASAWVLRGDADGRRGADPRPAYDAAIADFDEAARRLPGWSGTLHNRAAARLNRGEAALARGGDPFPDYQAAIADLELVLAREPGTASAHGPLGIAWLRTGEARLARQGEDAGAFARALACFDAAIAADPESVEIYNSRGWTRVRLGEGAAAAGTDARSDYDRALADLERAVAARPKFLDARTNLGTARAARGDAEADAGGDGRPWWEQALADYDAALALAPGDAMIFANRGLVHASLGGAEAGLGTDARGRFDRAIADYDEALRLDPRRIDALNNRGNAWATKGAIDAALGLDPEPAYRRALDDFRACVDLDPGFWRGRVHAGTILERLDRWEDAAQEYATALEQVGDAQPGLREKLARARAKAGGEGSLPAWTAIAARGREALRRGAYAEAHAAYEEALAAAGPEADAHAAADERLVRALAGVRYNLACLCALLSVGKTSPGEVGPAPPADEAARLRDQAFEWLRQALGSGAIDRAQVERDPDLAPLHDDPRWREVGK